MKEIRKQLYDEFCVRILQNYEDHCKKNELPESREGILTYLIDQGVIKPVSIRHYSISKEYPSLLIKANNHKSKTVRILAEKYNLSERAIWAVVKMFEKKRTQ